MLRRTLKRAVDPAERRRYDRCRALSAAAVLLALIGLTLTVRPAAAAPIGADGVVHACYKAKGKPKGALRVVKAGKKCKAKKGEKAIAWTVFGSSGTSGTQGDTGTTGDPGTDSASKQDLLTLLGLIQGQSALIDQLTGQLGALGVDVDSLTSQLDALGLDLDSLTGDVDGLQGILSGVTNAELTSAIDNVPVVSALCSQVSDITDQSDALRGALSVISNLLDPLTLGALPSLPAALGAFSC
jgi:hypothetical protein